MKKLILLATVAGMLLQFSGISSADNKVVGYIPSPEGDYQNLKAENFQVTGSSPQAGKVLTAADSQGTARWTTLPAGGRLTGVRKWYGRKDQFLGNENDAFGGVGPAAYATTDDGGCPQNSVMVGMDIAGNGHVAVLCESVA